MSQRPVSLWDRVSTLRRPIELSLLIPACSSSDPVIRFRKQAYMFTFWKQLRFYVRSTLKLEGGWREIPTHGPQQPLFTSNLPTLQPETT
jgi:hypothetical protein